MLYYEENPKTDNNEIIESVKGYGKGNIYSSIIIMMLLILQKMLLIHFYGIATAGCFFHMILPVS